MVGNVIDVESALRPTGLAESIVELYVSWDEQRRVWKNEQLEKNNFIFATDTTKTSNATLPWKNTTTRPKLTQIRDNIHANYDSAMFPNDQWFRWEAHSQDAALKEKAEIIEAYMSNKLRESGFENTISLLLYDYIDAGNAFCDVMFVNESKLDPVSGELIVGYIGPKLVRISPQNIVFNPTASSFTKSPKITRHLKTIGELMVEVEENPESGWIQEVLDDIVDVRKNIGNFTEQDFDVSQSYTIDGFGDLRTYYQSNFVEILELTGDIYDLENNELLKDHVITVLDRRLVARKQITPTWLAQGTMYHVGWRLRPHNIYAMGPLDNLVGMQYRIDHLENIKADVFDLIAFPPLKIIGEVKEFTWGPLEQIHIDEGGDVQMLVPDTTALNADLQIEILQQQMEEFAGAPREAMGIRSPGEKTAFEVQTLQNASSRIFQEKIRNFELNLLEPILNAMLEIAKRNINGSDLIRVLDDDLGVQKFLEVTKEDITAAGKLRPIGSRHFAAQAQLTQNLLGIFNSPVGQIIAPHVSGKRLARLIEDIFRLERFDIVEDNISIIEQLETQAMIQSGSEELGVGGTEEELTNVQTEQQPTQ